MNKISYQFPLTKRTRLTRFSFKTPESYSRKHTYFVITYDQAKKSYAVVVEGDEIPVFRKRGILRQNQVVFPDGDVAQSFENKKGDTDGIWRQGREYVTHVLEMLKATDVRETSRDDLLAQITGQSGYGNRPKPRKPATASS